MKHGENKKEKWIYIIFKVSKRQQVTTLHYNVYNFLKTNKRVKTLSYYIIYTTKLFFS